MRSRALLLFFAFACGCASGPRAKSVVLPSPRPAAPPAPAARLVACPAPAGDADGLEQDDRCGDGAACERACDAGAAPACVTAGNLLTSSPHPDVPRELALYGRACRLGNVLGCTNWGATARAGDRTPENLACAARLFALACDHREAYGCAMLAYAYAEGDGVPKDGHRALASLMRGCSRSVSHHEGVAMSCDGLVQALETSAPGPVRDRAIDLANRLGCDAGSAAACARLRAAKP